MAKAKKKTLREQDKDRDRKAIRDLEHWSLNGNTAVRPGGKFKTSMDFILAVERVTRIARDAMKRQEMAARVGRRLRVPAARGAEGATHD
jgi:hypothetical protein